MSKTGHASFDRWKDEFSATVRDIEAAMHERASSSSSSSSGTPAITDNDDNKDNATELIRRASTILAKLSSEAGKVSEREEPALKQELLDIYKACRMQIKTYKSLNKQRELFDDPSGGATTTRTKQTPMTKPATKPSVSEQRSSLFGSSAGTTPRNNNNNNNNGPRTTRQRCPQPSRKNASPQSRTVLRNTTTTRMGWRRFPRITPRRWTQQRPPPWGCRWQPRGERNPRASRKTAATSTSTCCRSSWH
mmetsp:Transcript_10151/g.23057  ORF Transcript_10151/g.23057 Transcript_10151/m.23057 type:complete len:249 (+) Transcript_10151:275-1021(+)